MAGRFGSNDCLAEFAADGSPSWSTGCGGPDDNVMRDQAILPDGSVDYEERFSATLNAVLDLRRFPFDKQVLDLEIQSFVWDRSELSMVVNEAQTGFDPDFETPEWKVTAIEGLIDSQSEIRDDREFSSFTFRIHAQRRAGPQSHAAPHE